MSIVRFLIKLLAGYDIVESEEKLRLSWSRAIKDYEDQKRNNDVQKRNIADLTERNSNLKEAAERNYEQLMSKTRELDAAKNEIESREKEYERICNYLTTRQEEINRLEKAVDELKAKNKSNQSTIMNHVKKINALEVEIKKNGEDKDVLSSQLETIQYEKADLLSVQDKLKSKIAALEQDLEGASKVKPEEIRELEAQIQDREETIQAKNREIEILNLQKEEDKKRFDEVCNELASVKSEKDAYNYQINELKNQNESLRKNEATLMQQVSELEAQLEKIKEKQGSAPKEPESKSEPWYVPEPEPVPVQEPVPVLEPHTAPEPKQIPEPEPVPIPEPDQDPKPVDGEKINKSTKPQKVKRKEVEAIEMSDGSIVDMPEITNDSNRLTQRTIEYVYDENGKTVYADEFFDRSAEEIAQVSRKMSEAEKIGAIYWTCGLCHHRIKIAHRTHNGRESLFFVHANRNHYCPWLKKATSSKDAILEEENLLATDEVVVEETIEDRKTKSRELKEKIFAILTSSASEDMGISDVQMDEIIRSNVPYMRWRRPDISFSYNGRKIVIELQKKSHGLDSIVDRDVFFRLNDIQILWVFGSDSDTSYEYMRQLNYKNTMFDNHRNVFVFDKEAQEKSEEEYILYLKCNWLNDDDKWHFRIENSGTNGKLVNIQELTYDDEYCKPFHYDANEEYFAKNPEARVAYLATKMSREELKKAIEEKWTRDSNYEDAMANMRQRNLKATPYCVQGLWGFRFNTTVIIPPIFTVEPKDLFNGYYLVNQGGNLGIVNYYGQKKVNWDGIIDCDDMNYDKDNKRILFARDNEWGVANLEGVELIPPYYDTIQNWNTNVYRVKKDGKWGLVDIDDNMLTELQFENIGDLKNGSAPATIAHPTKTWKTVSGYIDEAGSKMISQRDNQNDGRVLVESFELWGIMTNNGEFIVPCIYDEILPWADNLYRVKEDGKWGVLNVEDHSFILPTKYDSISAQNGGIAKVVFANVESSIDINGNEVAQEVIELQGGLKKTKVAGKWGIIDANGVEIIKHQYDEIGAFRSRMIGVINSKLIKLDANYKYPIYISGKFINSEGDHYYFNIGGVTCSIAHRAVEYHGKTISELCNSDMVCNKFGFFNLLFGQNSYILSILKEENLTRELTHGDGKEDFENGEELIGVITSFKEYPKYGGGLRRTKAMVKFPDGRISMVPRRFFKSSKTINDYEIGDSISLKKNGFDEELDQTIWIVNE
jgi:predicted  nucleic acid-binding Zn-ribbon protein